MPLLSLAADFFHHLQLKKEFTEMSNQKLIPLGVTSLAIQTQITNTFQECHY